MLPKFVLSRHSGLLQQFHWVLKAPNGEVILTSENYVSEAGALNGIESVRRNCKSDSNYRRLVSVIGQPYFTLNAPENGQVIGTSQMYASEQAREIGIASVKKNGTTTIVV